MSPTNVRDHIPLEQGLRLFNYFITIDIKCVRDHIPLEQGLRPAGYASELGVLPMSGGYRKISVNLKS